MTDKEIIILMLKDNPMSISKIKIMLFMIKKALKWKLTKI